MTLNPEFGALKLEAWNLFVIWSLDFGISIPCFSAKQNTSPLVLSPGSPGGNSEKIKWDWAHWFLSDW